MSHQAMSTEAFPLAMPREREPTPVSDLPPVARAAAQLETVPERARAAAFVFVTGVTLMILTQWLTWPPLRWGLVGLGFIVCLSVVAWVFKWSEVMPKHVETILAFVFGVVFVSVLLGVAFLVPEPKPFQYTVFRIVLALAAAGVAAVIPGILMVNPWKWLRAGGAFAVFVIVYFYAPAALEAIK